MDNKDQDFMEFLEADLDLSEIEVPEINLNNLETIVSKGVITKTSFIRYLRMCVKELGLKNIFHDKKELLVIALVGFGLLSISMVNLSSSSLDQLYKFTFIGSPIIYLSAIIFSFYNSKEKGAFDIEMTCKYNLYQLAALRMLTFSVFCILINSCSILIVKSFNHNLDVMRAIIISITGLFLFSTIFLYSLLRLKRGIAKYLVIASWILINIYLSSINTEGYKEFLIKAPLYIHLMISAICMILYIKNLSKIVNYRRKEGEL